MARQTGRVRIAGGRTRRVAVVCVVGALVAVAGCSKGGSNSEADAGASSVVASPSSAVSASSAASPSSAAPTPSVLPSSPVSASPSDQKLYDEAVQVLKKMTDLQMKIEAAGGFPAGVTAPKELTDLMMDQALEAKIGYFNNMYKAKAKSTGAVTLHEIAPAAPAKPGVLVAVRYCVDASRSIAKEPNGRTDRGNIRRVTAYFQKDSAGKLKWANSSGGKVSSCKV